MRAVRRPWHLLSALAVAAVANAQTGLPKDPPSVAPPPAAVAWIAGHAAELGGEDSPPVPAEARAIADITNGARVIGFGEPGHALGEPLVYRNRLIRHLVETGQLTAVALESGLADTRPVGDYVLGAPVVDDAALLRHCLSWRFGEFQANLDLARWLRAYNRSHLGRPVRLYGIDASVKLTTGSAPELSAETILADVEGALATLPGGAAATARADLTRFNGRFTSQGVRAMAAPERATLQDALDRATASLQQPYRAIPSADRAWLAREADDIRLLPPLLANWTTALPPDLGKITLLIRLRDRMMADNVQWALDREGPRGRILVFAANGHVTAAPMQATVLRGAPEQPDVMGVLLRRRLGSEYRAILTQTAFGSPASDTGIGSVDRAFVGAGKTRALLNVRAAPAGDWWSAPQTFTAGRARVDTAVPLAAADGILFIDRMTLAPLTVPQR